ncbi:hypothetical protein ACLMJK_009145 [Lecanora helva]
MAETWTNGSPSRLDTAADLPIDDGSQGAMYEDPIAMEDGDQALPDGELMEEQTYVAHEKQQVGRIAKNGARKEFSRISTCACTVEIYRPHKMAQPKKMEDNSMCWQRTTLRKDKKGES